MINDALSLEMESIYDLNNETVDTYIEKGKIGNYALGNIDGDSFYVCYVGRSDIDLNESLKKHINKSNKYRFFKFSYAMDIREAFIKECKNWHDFGGNEGLLDNRTHPNKPNGVSKIKCPYCED